MLATLASLLLAQETTNVAEEGKNIITVMLITGLVFVGVVLIGQLFRWLGHRRKHRQAASRRAY